MMWFNKKINLKFNLNNMIFVCLLFLYNQCTYSKVIIWDFGGITFNPDKLGVALNIGLHHFLIYMLLDFQNPNIQTMLFNFLEDIQKPDKVQYAKAGTAEGVPLPPIMCDWQAGKINGPEIIVKVNNSIKTLSKLGYFRSEREKLLVQKTINAMFDPKVLANNVYPLKNGINLLKECASARNGDGTKKNINIAFSNWDSMSFDIFYRLNKRYFKYFDEVLISGHIGLIKPDKKAFQYLIDKFKLDPKECILIDDQVVNTKGAEKCGMKTILLNNMNYKELRLKLQILGAL